MILYIEKKMGMYGCWSPSIKIFCAITTGGFECAGIWLITRTATPVTAAVNRITRTIFSQKCGTGALALISKASGFLVLPVPIAYKLLTSIAGKRPQVGNKVYVFFLTAAVMCRICGTWVKPWACDNDFLSPSPSVKTAGGSDFVSVNFPQTYHILVCNSRGCLGLLTFFF